MKVVTLSENLPPGIIDIVDLFGNIPYVLPDGTATYLEQHMDFCVRSIEELWPELENRELRYQDVEKIRSLLLIRRGGFGDLAFLSCCVAEIKRRNPAVVIDIAASKRFHPIFDFNSYVRRQLDSSFVPANQLLEYDESSWRRT